VGLKPAPDTVASAVRTAAKSNQGGIETGSTGAGKPAPTWAKSNQGGIETLRDADNLLRHLGQNRTKVGLKLDNYRDCHGCVLRQNRTKVGLKPGSCVAPSGSRGRQNRTKVGLKLHLGAEEQHYNVRVAKSNQGGIETGHV
jgi:hypothetical protein